MLPHCYVEGGALCHSDTQPDCEAMGGVWRPTTCADEQALWGPTCLACRELRCRGFKGLATSSSRCRVKQHKLLHMTAQTGVCQEQEVEAWGEQGGDVVDVWGRGMGCRACQRSCRSWCTPTAPSAASPTPPTFVTTGSSRQRHAYPPGTRGQKPLVVPKAIALST